jgi:hypothetical protein
VHCNLNKQDRITTCLLPHVDFLGNIAAMSCPNAFVRYFMNSPTNGTGVVRGFPKIPPLLKPLNLNLTAKQEQAMVNNELPIKFPECFKEGWRRRTSLALIRMTAGSISEASLR